MVKKTENMALEETRSVLHDLEIQKKSIKKQLLILSTPLKKRRTS